MTKGRGQNHILPRGKKGLALMFLELKQHPTAYKEGPLQNNTKWI